MARLLWAAAGVSLFSVLAVAAGAAADAPRVVVSIKPLHSLVATVMDGVASPDLLIEGAGSPHTYAVRPSQAQALQEADVVFWIGEQLEGFLAKPLQALPQAATLVALHEAEGVKLLAARAGGRWEPHDHGDDHEHDHGHDHRGMDMHIWLDPVNAQAMVAQIATTLATVDPENTQKYSSNAAVVRQDLAELDARLQEQLRSVQSEPYLVFHDAYRYFEGRYNLNALGSITITPDKQPGAQRLYEIRSLIVESGAKCVFREPQFEPHLVETVIEGTQARSGVLDPLGAELAPGPAAYFDLLDQLARSLHDCLSSRRGSAPEAEPRHRD